MFESLKKKFFSFFVKEKKPSKNKKKSLKKAGLIKEKKIKKTGHAKNLTIYEQKVEKDVEQIISETRDKSENIEKQEENNFFVKLVKKLSISTLSQTEFNEIFNDLEIILLEHNVALEAVNKIKEELEKNLVNQKIKKTEVESRIIQSLKDSILELLIEPPSLIEQIKKKQELFTIIFFGINGTGKTTTIAKIGEYLKKNNISCVFAAADTFRAASIEQLKVHAERLSIPIISHQYNADPAAVAFDAKKYAQSHSIKVVLIDTAGRMYTKENLLKEMEKIVRISQPDIKFFVGEAITGNDLIEQARTFNNVIGIDGIILTKVDIDEKAGALLSVSYVTKKPIYFLGIGQGYDDLQSFKKKDVLKHLGLG